MPFAEVNERRKDTQREHSTKAMPKPDGRSRTFLGERPVVYSHLVKPIARRRQMGGSIFSYIPTPGPSPAMLQALRVTMNKRKKQTGGSFRRVK